MGPTPAAFSIAGLVASATPKDETRTTKLHFLLGNVASEKVLLHLYHHGGGNVASIARDHALGIGATVRVLDRFVKAGLVRRERRGRVVWYTFETKNPIVRPLLEMLRQVYDSIPEPLRRAAFDPEYTPDV